MLKLDTTPAGADVTGDVPKYPVAVVLNAMNFDFSQAQPKGQDLRFATADGASLPYEIELWDATAKQAALWVKVDVKGNSTQMIKMSWGDPGASAASDAKAVFDVKDGFTGVWHLSEPGSTTADGYRESTANAAHAVGVAMTADATGDGRIGKAALLSNAKKQWIQVPLEKSTLYDKPEQMTYSIWFYAKSHTVSYQCIFSKGEGGFRIHYFGTSNITESCFESSIHNDICPVNQKNGTNASPGKWLHALVVHNHPNAYYYVNGKLEAMDDEPAAWKSDATKMVMIGNNASNTGRAFDGYLDEARLMNVVKDANWAKLEYESQKEGQKFLTVPGTN